MIRAIQSITDTLSNKPEVGVFASMFGVALSPTIVISLISAILGLIIAIITVIIKVMDLYSKLKHNKYRMISNDFIRIDGHLYRKHDDDDNHEE